jgi:mono/diheme cytochrome c family protein
MIYLRNFFLVVGLFALLVLGWAGFRGDKRTAQPIEIFGDMDRQAKLKAQSESGFFADTQGARPRIPGTVPSGLSLPSTTAGEVKAPVFSNSSDYYHTGRFGDFWGDGLPTQIKVDAALVRRGAERYGIYCAVCHGHAANGAGITGKYGIAAIANLMLPSFADPKDETYRTDGDIFNTITYGKGQMGGYGGMIPVDDRWAIIAYIRTLQTAHTSATEKK